MSQDPAELDALRRENGELRRLVAALEEGALASGADWALKLIGESRNTLPENPEWLLSLQDELNLSDIAANIPGAVYQCLQKQDGAISFPYISPTAEKLFGLPLSKLCDPDWVIGSIHPEDLPVYIESTENALNKLERWTSELRFLLPDGRVVWTFCSSSPRMLPDGGILWNGVILDITEYKRAEGALKESEARLRLLVKNSSDILVILDSDGTQRYVSPSAERITGFTDIELMGKSLAEIIHPDDMEKIAAAWNEAVEHPEKVVTVEYRHIHKTKGWVHLEAIGQNLESEPTVGGFVANVRDVTERKKAEEELRERNQELKVITDNMRDTVWLMDMDFRTTWMSPSVYHTRGYTLAELADMPIEKHLTPESLAVMAELSALHMTPERLADPSDNVTVSAELEFYRKDGTTFWADTVTTVLRDSAGRPSSILGVSRDVTERKRVEEALRKSEETFRNVVFAIPMGLHLYRLEDDGRLVFAGHNPAADRLLGVDHSQFTGMTIEEAFPPLRDTEIPERYKRAALYGESWQTEQINYDYERIKGAFEVCAFQMSPGKTAVLFNEITERKQAEEALKESEARFREMATLLPEAIFEAGPDLAVTYANRRAFEMFGLSPDDLSRSIKCFDLVSDEDRGLARANLARRLNGEDFGAVEYRALRSDGSVFPILLHLMRILKDGEVTGYRGVIVDISERKKAEQALKESEERYCELVENANSIILRMDRTGRINFINEYAQRFFGYEARDVLGKNVVGTIVPETDSEGRNLRLMIEEIGRNPDLFAANENENIRRDGTRVWIAWTNKPMYDAEGNVSELLCVGNDITERKRAEEALRESERRVSLQRAALGRLAVDQSLEIYDLAGSLDRITRCIGETLGVARASIWTFSPVDSTLQCVSLYEAGKKSRSLGPRLDKSIFPAYLKSIMAEKRIYAEDVQNDRRTRELADAYLRPLGITSMLEAAINIEGRFFGSVCCEHVGEKRKWHSDEESFSNTIASIVAQIFINHERKKAEKALRESERRHREIFEGSRDGFVMVDFGGRIIDANPAYCDLLGYSLDELKSLENFYEITPLKWRDWEASEIWENKLLGQGYSGVYEKEYIRKDGSIVPIELQSYVVRASNGEIEYLWGIARDITERKKAQSEIKSSEEKFRALAEHSVDVIMRFDRQLRHLYVNPMAEAQTGIKPEDFIGKTHRELGFPDHLVKSWGEAIEKVFVTACQSQMEFQLPNGTWVDWLLTPEFSGDGNVTAVITSARDITARKRAEEALEKRVIALVRPLDSPENIDIEDLFNLDDLQRLQDEFAAATGVASIITHTDGTPITRPSNFCRLCSDIIRKTEIGRRNCYRSDAVIGRACVEGPTVKPCLSGGLWDAGAGITVGGRHIANWLIGQVRDETQTPENMRAYAKKIGADEEEFMQAFLEVPAMKRARFEKISRALFTLASQLSAFAYQNVQQARFITESKRAEEERQKLHGQLAQAQKMESVGRLAGGVAHDFNNMLGGIIGYAEMALEQTDPSQPVYGDLLQIRKAAERSSELTQQLLGFARKQTVAPKVLNLNETVEGMLRRLIGEDIDLAWIPGKDLDMVKVDPAQIDQILANLCINAKDAISEKGKVTIETGNVVMDESYCAGHAGVVPGMYVLLAVSDNGSGMDRETVQKIFEPFFTTKEVGRGTGLGLATVYGIVRQNRGYINVYSEPGRGTTFKIYLPKHTAKEERPQDADAAKAPVRGSETILVVEDEPVILAATAKMLKRQGYKVLAAATPGEAVRTAAEYDGDIHLLMTDVVMPEMNGRDLAKKILSFYPNLKRLFMSGYTANVIAHHGVLDEGVNFIQKPFTPRELAARIREALAG